MTRLLKQRLIGAIVLISLGIIFIPMFLSGGGSLFDSDSKSNVPPKPMYEIKTPVALPQQKHPAGEPVAAPATSPATATQAANQQAASNQPNSNPATGDKANQPAAVTTQTDNGNTTSTAQAAKVPSAADIAAAVAKANQLASKPPAPAADKPAAKSDDKPKQVPPADAPTPTKQIPPAQTVATVSKPPAEPAPTPTPEKKPVVSGWVVQLGSFAVEKNALTLRDRLRKNGYASFVESYTTQQNKTIYRVRVGPELTRELADKLQVKLKVATQLTGVVMPFPAK